jgi:O-antigen ligase
MSYRPIDVAKPLTLLTILALILSTGLSTHLALTDSLHLISAIGKYFWLAMLMLLLTYLAFRSTIKVSPLLVFFFLLFPVYHYILSAFWKQNLVWSVVALYFVWSFYLVILSPWLAKNLEAVINVFFLGSALLLIMGITASILGLYSEEVFRERPAFGYENPNYFAQFCQVLTLSAFMKIVLFKCRDWMRLFLVCWIFMALIFIFNAGSRNVIVGLSLFFAIYFAQSANLKTLFKVLIPVFIVAVFAVFSVDDMDNYSSGRFQLWVYYLVHILEESDWSLFLGAIEVPDASHLVSSYSVLSDETKLAKFHVDNMYLELLVEGGVIGLILFVIPYWMVWKKYLGPCLDSKKRFVFNALLGSLIIQSIFITSFTSFFSPISLFMGSLFLMLKEQGDQ